MSNNISPVAVVFRDFYDAFDELSTQKLSPRKVRTTFSNFLELSYRLTQTMYGEYHQKTGKKWDAKDFAGWDEVSEFFKRLRTIDTHEHTVLIQVYERHFYGVAEDSTDRLEVEWTWSLGDPHSNAPPEGMRLTAVDPDAGQARGLIPIQTEYELYLYPLSEEVDAELLELGGRNVHSLSKKYFCYTQKG